MTGPEEDEARSRRSGGLEADWLTIWTSELAARAHDREWTEAAASLAQWWASGMRAAMTIPPPLPDADASPQGTPSGGTTSGRPGTQPPAGSAAAAAASDAGDAAARIDALVRRIDELERRLAALDPDSAA